ncbi:hypothetical protein GOV03_04685 [Candidatus Woesearchaeota archaeon]|nr:hypothetical protein [Candidatus Woesearchaeota archaeon]
MGLGEIITEVRMKEKDNPEGIIIRRDVVAMVVNDPKILSENAIKLRRHVQENLYNKANKDY